MQQAIENHIQQIFDEYAKNMNQSNDKFREQVLKRLSNMEKEITAFYKIQKRMSEMVDNIYAQKECINKSSISEQEIQQLKRLDTISERDSDSSSIANSRSQI